MNKPALVGIDLSTLIEERSMLPTIRDHGSAIRHLPFCESNGGPFGTGAMDFPLVLETLRASGYAGYLSVKIYRHLPWDKAAQSAADFLRPLGMGARD